jgi:CheY-like chemotaxis protein
MASVDKPATILLVDDDPALRQFIRRILIQQQLQVIDAADGAAALEVASTYPDRIHLLLTDVVMPKVNGLVLAERLLQERPDISVICMSGYVERSVLLAKRPESIVLVGQLDKGSTPSARMKTAVKTAPKLW